MLGVQSGLIGVASLAADLVEQFLGPSEIVPIAVPAEGDYFDHVEALATGRADLVALNLVLVGRWLLVAFEVHSTVVAVAVAE